MSEWRIVDLVFARTDPQAGRRAAAACAVSGGVALSAVAAIALHRGPACECGVRQPLVVDRTVAVQAPPVRPPAPDPPAVPPPPSERADPPSARDPSRAARTPAVFAQAASIVAREPSADEPIDLTAEAFVTGSGPVFGGGLTTSSGTSSGPVRALPGPALGAPARVAPRAPPAVSRARPVGLPDPSWTCPWPAGAEAESFDEQSAFVQVTVRPDGSVESAVVLVDPGMGFGEAARRCASVARFAPALDAGGAPVRATSPPIRVRFMR